MKPISAPVEMEASDGQAYEREKPLEQVTWGWGCEGGRKGGPCRGWLGKAEKISVKEEERGKKMVRFTSW